MQIVVIFCMHSQIKNEWENITIKYLLKNGFSYVSMESVMGNLG